jgi:phosphoribosyl 1,2-cyclic phosphodiesterase
MAQPYFPVPFSIFPAQTEFVELSSGPLQIGETMISWKAVNHPGGCFSYRFEENNKVVIFSTDTELTTKDFEKPQYSSLFTKGLTPLSWMRSTLWEKRWKSLTGVTQAIH